jgi:hypothetical protein
MFVPGSEANIVLGEAGALIGGEADFAAAPDVRFESKADIATGPGDVRFVPIADIRLHT